MHLENAHMPCGFVVPIVRGRLPGEAGFVRRDAVDELARPGRQLVGHLHKDGLAAAARGLSRSASRQTVGPLLHTAHHRAAGICGGIRGANKSPGDSPPLLQGSTRTLLVCLVATQADIPVVYGDRPKCMGTGRRYATCCIPSTIPGSVRGPAEGTQHANTETQSRVRTVASARTRVLRSSAKADRSGALRKQLLPM
eukprot:977008-Pyramimonas_sp.AAC.1